MGEPVNYCESFEEAISTTDPEIDVLGMFEGTCECEYDVVVAVVSKGGSYAVLYEEIYEYEDYTDGWVEVAERQIRQATWCCMSEVRRLLSELVGEWGEGRSWKPELTPDVADRAARIIDLLSA